MDVLQFVEPLPYYWALSLVLSYWYYESHLHAFAHLHILPKYFPTYLIIPLGNVPQKYISKPNGKLGSLVEFKHFWNLRLISSIRSLYLTDHLSLFDSFIKDLVLTKHQSSTQTMWPRFRSGAPIRSHSMPQTQPWVSDSTHLSYKWEFLVSERCCESVSGTVCPMRGPRDWMWVFPPEETKQSTQSWSSVHHGLGGNGSTFYFLCWVCLTDPLGVQYQHLLSPWAFMTCAGKAASRKQLEGHVGQKMVSFHLLWCALSLQKGEADAMSLDGGHIYIAGKCGLVPVLAENYSKWKGFLSVFHFPWAMEKGNGKSQPDLCHMGHKALAYWAPPTS